MKDLILQLVKEATQEIHNTTTPAQLEELRIKYLGRKGSFTNVMQNLKSIPNEEKPAIGQALNAAKNELEQHLTTKQKTLEEEVLKQQLNDDSFDTTRPGTHYETGHIHPLSQVQKEVEEIFSQMGFAIQDGPEIESEYYNFEALNVPKDHPARDMQDTFFLADKSHDHHGRMVLRTQTSPVQIRTMEKFGAPLRVIVPGRVFRYEATDASHDSTFYQVEGLLIDKNISLANLKGVMTEFLTRLFKKETKVRFRPGYFPFVEPGIELDMWCLLCSGMGCRVCKHTGWMEFMGAGMVHANVLRAGGIDPEVYQGWAFGFGLTRLVMMKYGIDDIRLLMGGDLRFLEQF